MHVDRKGSRQDRFKLKRSEGWWQHRPSFAFRAFAFCHLRLGQAPWIGARAPYPEQPYGATDIFSPRLASNATQQFPQECLRPADQ
jgi:hypothetical protein